MRKRLTPQAVATTKQLLKRRHRYLVRRLFTPPLTVCHGDVHLDNIFFSPDFPGGLKMIDFGNMFFGQVAPSLSP